MANSLADGIPVTGVPFAGRGLDAIAPRLREESGISLCTNAASLRDTRGRPTETDCSSDSLGSHSGASTRLGHIVF